MQNDNDYEGTTYLWVAEVVLSRQKRPLRATDIVQIAIEDGLFGDRALSKTPQKSMQARLSMDILALKENSRFLRTGPGRFFLRALLDSEDQDRPQNEDPGLAILEYFPPRRTPPPPSERVLVIARRDYEAILDFQGIDLTYPETIDALLKAPSLTYISRSQAEISDEYKQFVTYTIIQSADSVLAFRRGQYNRAANFLRGARCIGFGGHVNEDDLDIFSYKDKGIRANVVREIGEEIRLPNGPAVVNPDDLHPIGILNDDSSEIGRRHLALIMRYSPSDQSAWATPLRGEASINQLQWVELGRKPVNLPDYEYWSQLCLRKLFPSYISGEPSYRIQKRSVFSKKHTLCIVGSIGSGKTVTTSIVKEECGYTEINTGHLVAELLGIPPVPQTERSKFQILAQQFIEQRDGPSRLASRIASIVNANSGKLFVIDGIRHTATFEELRKLCSLPLAMVYVQTPPDVAFELYRTREHTNTELSLSEFMDILNAPSETEIRYLISEASAVIYNWHGLDSYKRVVAAFVDDAGIGDHFNA